MLSYRNPDFIASGMIIATFGLIQQPTGQGGF